MEGVVVVTRHVAIPPRKAGISRDDENLVDDWCLVIPGNEKIFKVAIPPRKAGISRCSGREWTNSRIQI